MPKTFTPDSDVQKGATEDGLVVPVSQSGQLPQRGQPDDIKDFEGDSSEPEPSPEHSGQNKTGDHKHEP